MAPSEDEIRFARKRYAEWQKGNREEIEEVLEPVEVPQTRERAAQLCREFLKKPWPSNIAMLYRCQRFFDAVSTGLQSLGIDFFTPTIRDGWHDLLAKMNEREIADEARTVRNTVVEIIRLCDQKSIAHSNNPADNPDIPELNQPTPEHWIARSDLAKNKSDRNNLASYQAKGHKAADGKSGCDTQGRKWRKDGDTHTAQVYYFKPSLTQGEKNRIGWAGGK